LHRAQKTQISGFFNAAQMVYRLGGFGGFYQVKKVFFYLFILLLLDPHQIFYQN
jgi:hypothetical protein